MLINKDEDFIAVDRLEDEDNYRFVLSNTHSEKYAKRILTTDPAFIDWVAPGRRQEYAFFGCNAVLQLKDPPKQFESWQDGGKLYQKTTNRI